MILPVLVFSNLVLTQQIYSEETNGAHAHNRDRVPLISVGCWRRVISLVLALIKAFHLPLSHTLFRASALHSFQLL